jgi:hypothetical protein
MGEICVICGMVPVTLAPGGSGRRRQLGRSRSDAKSGWAGPVLSLLWAGMGNYPIPAQTGPFRTLFTKTQLWLSASFNQAYTFGRSSCCPTDLVTTHTLPSYVSSICYRCHQVYKRVISVSQVILLHPRSLLVAVHPRRCPL